MQLTPKLKTTLTFFSFIFVIAVIYANFNSIVFYPMKMFVVAMHESSHAIATLLTGGEIKGFTMYPEQGGKVDSLIIDGRQWIVAMSGYLGSLVIGIFLLHFSSISEKDEYIVLGLAIWMLIFTVLYFSDMYTLGFGIVSSLILGVIFLVKQNILSDLLLKFVGLFSVIYVPHDIFDDTISRSHLKSDAYLMSQHLGLTTNIWGWIWLILSILVIFFGMISIIKSIYMKYVNEEINKAEEAA